MAWVGVLVAAWAAHALADGIAITGRWLTADGSAVIRVAACAPPRQPLICGRVESYDDLAGAPTRGALIGRVVLDGFTRSGRSWRGRIYDPELEATFSGRLRGLPDGTLRVEICEAGVCEGETWRRLDARPQPLRAR